MLPDSPHAIYTYPDGTKWELLSEKCAYWPARQTLIISDAHIGKITHFRKNGIPIPLDAENENFEVLDSLMLRLDVKKVIWLGDLFHSKTNSSVQKFELWRNKYSHVQMVLVIGNHDILESSTYSNLNLSVEEKYIIDSMVFSHEPLVNIPDGYYNVAGHIHPMIQLIGGAKQSLTLPCFYFSMGLALMPAFGKFTGGSKVNPLPGDNIYAIPPHGNLIRVL
jgi:DNA ligase-associated metallophosphoesterase